MLRWFPLVLPVVGYNTTDGLGVGLGGEVYARPETEDEGFTWKFTGGPYLTTDLAYQSHQLRMDHRGKYRWAARGVYRLWDDLAYAGHGGGDVLVDWGDAEGGSAVRGPYGFVGVAIPIEGTVFMPYAQVYARSVAVEPGEGSRLEELAPYGAWGGTTADVTLGVEVDRTDKWPLPASGVKAEIGVSPGLTWAKDAVGKTDTRGALTVHGEVAHWLPAPDDRLVIGTRVVADRAFGDRPFYEQDLAGGRWRDEIGSEQLLAGYGRTRTRGDGLVAGIVEVRPRLLRTSHPFWDVGLHLSLFAEQAWLFDGGSLGPPLPTVGGGPEILWQKALVLRPFVAWGWRTDTPGGDREPRPQFGVSFLDPL